MSTQQKYKGGKKARKLGRNKKWCDGYKALNTQLKNKLRKIGRHLKEVRHSNDKQARQCYLELGGKNAI